jgi:hypothetical protein
MDTTALLPDDHKVTLTWTTTAIDEYERTFTLGELREAVGAERGRENEQAGPDLEDDLDLLRESWLGDHEDEGSNLIEFTREITGHTRLGLKALPEYTVTVDDSEDERECPHTYVLHAPDLDAAIALATAHHTESFPADYPAGSTPPNVLTGPWWTFTGAPNWPAQLPGRAWNDLRENEDLLKRAYTMAGAR